MNKGIIKCLKNSIGEKGNYCYSLPVETTKAVIKELNRLNNIINELEKWLIKHIDEYRDMEQDAMFEFGLVLDKLRALKENNKDVC